MKKENNLIWIDLEMTGLNSNRDLILEIASIVTDANLTIIAEGPSLVISQPKTIFEMMDEWVTEQHTKTGLLEKVSRSTISIEQAEQETLTFLKKYCISEVSPLCGNSVWKDRAFLQQFMPELDSFFHYRLVDVSSFKEMVVRWYPNNPQAKFKKKDTHRALDDIKESIDELRHYKKYFFV